MKLLTITLGFTAMTYASAAAMVQPQSPPHADASQQQPMSLEDPLDPPSYIPPSDDDFVFENPRTDCAYVSQPWIYHAFNGVRDDMGAVFRYAAPDLTVRIMGHHPFAGFYPNPKTAFVNSLWRLNNCLKDRKVDARIWALHGACESAWSVQEFYFNGTTNKGEFWELTSLWVSRWGKDRKIHEVRTYVDAGMIIRTLMENEIWFNASDRVTHTALVPGPSGLPGVNDTVFGELFDDVVG